MNLCETLFVSGLCVLTSFSTIVIHLFIHSLNIYAVYFVLRLCAGYGIGKWMKQVYIYDIVGEKEISR